ncbi:MAG: tyrosine-type recombinase/integrase [Candidatus Bipolaricaulia bacterium]
MSETGKAGERSRTSDLFATDLYRETTNTRLTQKGLGHSNLATTQIYTHIVDEELEGALKSFRCATVAA